MTPATPTILVPFPRRIKAGSSGRDVRATKRALRRAGYGHGIALTPLMGPVAMRAVHKFQKDHGVRMGVYDLATHRKLARYFDTKGAAVMATREAELHPPDVAIRKKIVAAMLLLYHNREAVHYTQGPKRMQGVLEHLRPPKFPTYADCSAAATWAYYAAGAADPNALGYNGTGYTGTLAMHGRVVGLAQAKIGDLVLYGRARPWEHVAVYCGGGRVLSHGSEAGPYLLPIDYRSDRGEIRSYL